MLNRRSDADPQLLGLFEESGRNTQRAALLIRELEKSGAAKVSNGGLEPAGA